jgi:hypothetical protein
MQQNVFKPPLHTGPELRGIGIRRVLPVFGPRASALAVGSVMWGEPCRVTSAFTLY